MGSGCAPKVGGVVLSAKDVGGMNDCEASAPEGAKGAFACGLKAAGCWFASESNWPPPEMNGASPTSAGCQAVLPRRPIGAGAVRSRSLCVGWPKRALVAIGGGGGSGDGDGNRPKASGEVGGI